MYNNHHTAYFLYTTRVKWSRVEEQLCMLLFTRRKMRENIDANTNIEYDQAILRYSSWKVPKREKRELIVLLKEFFLIYVFFFFFKGQSHVSFMSSLLAITNASWQSIGITFISSFCSSLHTDIQKYNKTQINKTIITGVIDSLPHLDASR